MEDPRKSSGRALEASPEGVEFTSVNAYLQTKVGEPGYVRTYSIRMRSQLEEMMKDPQYTKHFRNKTGSRQGQEFSKKMLDDCWNRL